VISTIGIHDCALRAPLLRDRAEARADGAFETPPTSAPSAARGLCQLDRDADAAARARRRPKRPRSPSGKTFRFYPKVYNGGRGRERVGTYEDYSLRVRELEARQAISLRHLLDLQPAGRHWHGRAPGRPALVRRS